MKPAPFDYRAPTTLEEALDLLAEHGDEAKVLAGGQSLVPTMNFRLAQPALLVDINRIPELAGVEPGANGLEIGATTRQRVAELHPAVAAGAPLLSCALPFVAHPQIRNRGTVGGSLAHADPAAELPATMLASEAQFLLQRRGGERWVDARDFYTGLFATALQPDEILTRIRLPTPRPREGVAFTEIARRHGDYALVGVACRLLIDPDGRCTAVSIALLSVGEGPLLLRDEALPVFGESASPERLRETAHSVAAGLDPPTDIHASAAFRRHLASVLCERGLEQAVASAKRAPG